MAAKSAILSIKILSDAKKGRQGLEDTASGVDRLEGRLDALTPAATVAMGAIAMMGGKAYDAAKDLQATTGAVETVFGEYAAQVEGFAADAADNVGLATSEYQDMATTVGQSLKNLGTPMDEVAGKSDDLIGLGADLASTFGGDTQGAVDALTRALTKGRYGGLSEYGIALDQADVKAKAVAMGLAESTDAVDDQAQSQAAMAMILQQTSDVQGAFADSTGDAATQQEIASAKYQDAKAALGEQLLPAITKVTENLGKFADWVSENTALVTTITGVVAGLAAGVLTMNAAIKVARTVTTAYTVAQKALNLAMRMNPLGLVLTAITAIVAIVVTAYKKSETFRNGVNALWAAFKAGLSGVVNRLAAFGRMVGDAASLVREGLGAAWDWVTDKWNTFYGYIMRGINGIKSVIRQATSLISNMFSFSMPGWMQTAASWVGGLFSLQAPPEDDTGEAVRTMARRDRATTEVTRPAAFAPAAAGGPTGPAAGGTGGPNITITGAIDPEGTARQIERILTKSARRRGVRNVGQALWAQ